MSGRALALAAVAGLALLVGIGVAAIVLLDRPGPEGTTGVATPAEPAAPETARAWAISPYVLATTDPAPARPAHVPPADAIALRGVIRPPEERPAAPGAAPWESVETALRPAALGPDLAAPVSDGLAEARDGMQHCFDEETRRLAHEGPARRPPVGTGFGPAILILRLEALDGRLSVAGVEVATSGTSSPQLIDCCRKALLGYEIAVPAVRPPERFRVTIPLM